MYAAHPRTPELLFLAGLVDQGGDLGPYRAGGSLEIIRLEFGGDVQEGRADLGTPAAPFSRTHTRTEVPPSYMLPRRAPCHSSALW